LTDGGWFSSQTLLLKEEAHQNPAVWCKQQVFSKDGTSHHVSG
jgi:hypothetical protein